MIEGFLVGVLSSLAVWWLIQRILAPQIQFGDTVKINVDSAYVGGRRYVIEFRNVGSRRAFDVEIFARLLIEDLRPGSLFRRHIVPLKLNRNRIPLMRNDGRKNYASLDLYAAEELGTEHFPMRIQEAFRNRNLRLENLMNLGSHVELVLVIMAYDEWSGSRKLFVSKSYTWDDLEKEPANRAIQPTR